MFERKPVTVDDYDLISLHWMARRYADGRSSYSPGLFNSITRKLLKTGVILKTPHFARDGMGRSYDGLTDEQVAEAADDMPRGFIPEADERLSDALAALQKIANYKLVSSADFNAADMREIARNALAKSAHEHVSSTDIGLKSQTVISNAPLPSQETEE